MPLPIHDQAEPICPNCRKVYAVGQAHPIAYECTGVCKETKRAFMRVSVGLLNEALHIPPGYSLVSDVGYLNLVVEGTDLPEPNADGSLKEVSPVITRTWEFEQVGEGHNVLHDSHTHRMTAGESVSIHSGGGKSGP